MHRVLHQMHKDLGQVCEVIVEQCPTVQRSENLNNKLYQALRLRDQYNDQSVKPRLYGPHEPNVVCIAKGKARQSLVQRSAW